MGAYLMFHDLHKLVNYYHSSSVRFFVILLLLFQLQLLVHFEDVCFAILLTNCLFNNTELRLSNLLLHQILIDELLPIISMLSELT